MGVKQVHKYMFKHLKSNFEQLHCWRKRCIYYCGHFTLFICRFRLSLVAVTNCITSLWFILGNYQYIADRDWSGSPISLYYDVSKKRHSILIFLVFRFIVLRTRLFHEVIISFTIPEFIDLSRLMNNNNIDLIIWCQR